MTTATSRRWQWRWLLAAPHPLCFFAGAATMALLAAWWAARLRRRPTPAVAGRGRPWPAVAGRGR